MSNQKLLNRNFTMVVVGQIISLLGNAILSFALPLHLLRLTGSAAVFGTVMAISVIPSVLLSPIGGILADRINRRNIMVALDYITCGIILLSGVFIGSYTVATISVVLLLLSVIRSFYQPAVNACIPSITADANLLRANSVVNTVSGVSMLIGPILGGILYGFWGITPIIWISAGAFFLSAVMEMFIRLPFTRQPLTQGILGTVKQDFSESFHFISKKKPVIGTTIIIAAFINMVISSLLTIGEPYIINITLGLSSELYGIAQSLLGIGSLAGGVLVGVLAGKLTTRYYHWLQIGLSISILPMGLTLMGGVPVMTSFWVVAVSCFFVMVFAGMMSIAAITLIQQLTPSESIGKVIALTLAFCNCATPMGQAIYGFLFEAMPARPYLIIFGAGVISLVVALASRRVWQQVSEQQPEGPLPGRCAPTSD
ncbi:MAG: MFS transporter [Angelakisella sp.]